MRILFDHCVPRRLRRSLTGHEIKTAAEMGWEQLRNGMLLSAAAEAFDVVLTTDTNVRHQQNLATLPVAVVVIIAGSNKLGDLIPLVPEVQEALKTLKVRTLVEVRAKR